MSWWLNRASVWNGDFSGNWIKYYAYGFSVINPFEPVEMFEGVEVPPSPPLLVSLALLNVKLVMDIITLEQSTASFYPKVPQEILDIINEFISQESDYSTAS